MEFWHCTCVLIVSYNNYYRGERTTCYVPGTRLRPLKRVEGMIVPNLKRFEFDEFNKLQIRTKTICYINK